MNRKAAEARKTILLLGAIDMDHVIAAAEAVQREHQSGVPNLSLLRALETAVVVCYWRPFAQSNTLGHLRKSDAHDPALHAQMKTWRNQAHAHTDESSGRTAGIKKIVTPTGIEGLAFSEGWWDTPPGEELPRIIDAAIRQRDAWRAEADGITRRLSE